MSDGLVTLLRLHIQATLGSDLIGTIGPNRYGESLRSDVRGWVIGADDVGVFRPAMLLP
jgi:hypothetical protein